MKHTTIMPDFYNTSDFQQERTKKRKPYMTKKRRNQEIIDEAENVKRTDRLTWVCIGALCIIDLILLKVFVL